MPSAILVTGGAGFAGSHLIELLSRDGLDIVAWHRPGGAPPRPAPVASGSSPTDLPPVPSGLSRTDLPPVASGLSRT